MASTGPSSLTVVDANVIIASMIPSDEHHEAAGRFVTSLGVPVYVPVMALAEIAHFLEKKLGPAAEVELARAIAADEIRPIYFGDRWSDLHELASQYLDSKLGVVDASVVLSAEHLNTRRIATLDLLFHAVVPDAGPLEVVPIR